MTSEWRPTCHATAARMVAVISLPAKLIWLLDMEMRSVAVSSYARSFACTAN